MVRCNNCLFNNSCSECKDVKRFKRLNGENIIAIFVFGRLRRYMKYKSSYCCLCQYVPKIHTLNNRLSKKVNNSIIMLSVIFYSYSVQISRRYVIKTVQICQLIWGTCIGFKLFTFFRESLIGAPIVMLYRIAMKLHSLKWFILAHQLAAHFNVYLPVEEPGPIQSSH